MINLGDVNFSLGAETADLQRAVRHLQSFGQTVATFQTQVQRSADQTAAALRRQEKASLDAAVRVQNLTNAMRGFQGTDRFINSASTAYERFNNSMLRGNVTTLEFQRAQERLKVELADVQRSFKNHISASQGVNAANAKMVAGLQNLSSTALLVSGPLSGIATRITSLVTVMKRGGFETAALVAGFSTGIYAIGKFASIINDAGVQMKGFQSQFQAVTGNAPAALNKITEALIIARNTGQELSTIAPSLARFEAAASGTAISAKTIRDTFYSVSAASSKMYMSTEQTTGIFRALEQMISKGTVQAEELRGQLGDRLPGAFNIMARALGVTTSKLGEMMKKGQVITAEVLPKFIKELRKTFNIDGKPIDNYTAAVNNSRTAWFELRAELDKQLGVSDRVMQAYKATTTIMDTLRLNLGKVKVYATALVGALTGLFAPVMITYALNLSKVIAGLATSMLGLNVAMNANPVLGLINLLVRLGLIVGTTAAALAYMGDDTAALSGEFDTLNGWIRALSGGLFDAKDIQSSWIIQLGRGVIEIWTQAKGVMADAWNQAMAMNDAAVADVNKLFDYGSRWAATIKTWWKGGTGVEEIWKAPDATPYTDFFRGVKKGIDEVKQAAEEAGKIDLLGRHIQSEKAGYDSSKYRKPIVPEIETGGKSGESKIRRQREALKAYNDELAQTYARLEALKQGPGAIDALNKKFEQDEYVEKYAKSLRQAGFDAKWVAEKVEELRQGKIKLDEAMKQNEAFEAMQNSWMDAFDSIADSLITALATGKDVFKSLVEVAKQAALDILKTWMQLSLLNPLKNWLFNLQGDKALPTMGGMGESGPMSGIFGKIFSSIFGFLKSFFKWGKNGLILQGATKMMKAGDILTKPTKMMSAGGPIIGGEAGMEALMPLTRDSKGRLGVRASGGQGGIQKVQIALELSPDLEARILGTANENAASISLRTARAYNKSKAGIADTQRNVGILRGTRKL